jgi:glycosyltransferase involved in cell wall biosynthesis
MKNKSIGLFIYADSRAYPPTINAANILAELGYRVFIYDLFSTKTPDRIRINSAVNVVHLGFHFSGLKNVLLFCQVLFLMPYFTYRHRLSTLISYDAYSVLAAYLCKRLHTKIKWIYHQHDFWENPIGNFQKILHCLEHKLVSNADYVSFPQVTRSEIFSKKSKLRNQPLIVHNGPRKQWVSDNIACNNLIFKLKLEGNFIFIYQGGLSKYFGLEKLIEAIGLLTVKSKLVILGKELENNYLDELKSLVVVLKLESEIIFWDDYVSYDDLPSITSFCDFGITKLTIPDSEAPINDRFLAGASNKIIEYLASGLPLVCANSLDNSVFMGNEQMGILCDVSEPALIAEGINELLEKDDLRVFISKRNRDLFNSQYSFDVQFRKIVDLIE